MLHRDSPSLFAEKSETPSVKKLPAGPANAVISPRPFPIRPPSRTRFPRRGHIEDSRSLNDVVVSNASNHNGGVV